MNDRVDLTFRPADFALLVQRERDWFETLYELWMGALVYNDPLESPEWKTVRLMLCDRAWWLRN